MQKREIKNLDRSETNGRESGRTTAKHGRKNSSKKSGKASSQRQQNSGKASDAKKQRGGQRRPVFKLADLLTDEEIKRLKAIK